MKVKLEKVSLLALHPSAEHALNIVDEVWKEVTRTHPVVTGLGEEGHSDSSLHYGVLGDIRTRAFDIRSRDLSETQRTLIDVELRARLGTVFDIVWEGSHLHIEFDPS